MGTGQVLPILTTAILSALGTLLVTWFGQRLALSKDKQLRQEEIGRLATYLAVRVICTLDAFVTGCVRVVSDQGEPDETGETCPSVPTPSISFPEELDWKSINPRLMYKLLDFPNRIEMVEQTLALVGNEIATAPDYRAYFEERTIQYGKLGLLALTLSEELRIAYQIPESDFGDIDPKETLEDVTESARRSQNAATSLRAKLLETIESRTAASRDIGS